MNNSLGKLFDKTQIKHPAALKAHQAPETLELDQILAREQDTRPLNVAHVAALAESIAAIGLIHALPVDTKGQLLAGGHRRAALQLLRETQADRFYHLFPSGQIPIRRFEFDALTEPDRALAIEASENEKRRDYSKSEIMLLASRLRAAGYRDVAGKPKQGQKALKPAMALVLGKSLRQVQRYLNEAEKEDIPDKETRVSLLKKVQRSLTQLVGDGQTTQQQQSHAKQLMALIQAELRTYEDEL